MYGVQSVVFVEGHETCMVASQLCLQRDMKLVRSLVSCVCRERHENLYGRYSVAFVEGHKTCMVAGQLCLQSYSMLVWWVVSCVYTGT